MHLHPMKRNPSCVSVVSVSGAYYQLSQAEAHTMWHAHLTPSTSGPVLAVNRVVNRIRSRPMGTSHMLDQNLGHYLSTG